MDAAFYQQLAPVDWIGLGIVAVLLVMGLVRGLWWQVIRLLGVVVAFAVARLFGPDGAAWIGEVYPDWSPRLAHGLAWVVLFGLTLAAVSILGHLGQKLLTAMQLGPVNRLAGGVAGAATGVVVHLALLLGISLLTPEAFVREHVAGTYSERVYSFVGEGGMSVVLGAEAVQELQLLFDPDASEEEPEVPLLSDPAEPNGVR